MKRKIGRWIYGDHSYYIAHIVVGIIVMGCIGTLVVKVFRQPVDIVLRLISNETISLSATLLGFQIAGVSILISSEGNRKLSLLRKMGSDTMIYKVFISSILMFLLSIVLMLISLNLFYDIEKELLLGKLILDYCSIIAFVFGIVFLFSSIQLLKWLCVKR